MKQIHFLVRTSIVVIALTTAVSAQNLEDSRTKERPFIAIATGASGFGYSDDGLEAKDIGDAKHSGAVVKLEAGYWFSDHWGASINYVDLGKFEQKFTQGTFRGTGDSAGVSILGRLPFGESWTLIGKANISNAEVEDDGSKLDSVSLDKLTGKETSLVPGIEIDYHINDQAAVFLELEGRGSVSDDAGVGFAGVGLRWAF